MENTFCYIWGKQVARLTKETVVLFVPGERKMLGVCLPPIAWDVVDSPQCFSISKLENCQSNSMMFTEK